MPTLNASAHIHESIREFAPSATTLLPGSALYRAQQAAQHYICELDPDRLLYPFRREAGLAQPLHNGTPVTSYPNWENTGLDGHIGGHYLSGLADFWSITHKEIFRTRTLIMLRGLRDCQQAIGTGFIGGMPHSRRLFDQLRAQIVRVPAFDLNGSWVLLYNMHKTFAGLIDTWTLYASDGTNDPRSADAARLAKRLVLRLADWWCGVSRCLDDEHFAQMLKCEYGGLNESFAQLYELTGRTRYLREAHRFELDPVFQFLSRGEDRLTGLHANTQIPKILGYARVAHITGNPAVKRAVDTFWNSVTRKRSISIGAHSVSEHFNSCNDFSSMIRSNQGVETCNSYNMSKLAEMLYGETNDTDYLDFWERVSQNHIASAVSGEEDGFVYFTPMRPRHYCVYSTAQKSFWCCVGTGLEMHARYGRMIYMHDPSTPDLLYVNAFTPSRLVWSQQGISLTQQYGPAEGVHNRGTLTFTANDDHTHKLTVKIRHPRWVTAVDYRVRGEDAHCTVHYETQLDDHTTFDRLTLCWKGTCTIDIDQTVSVRFENMPDGSDWVSIMRRPIVMTLRDLDSDLTDLKAGSARISQITPGPLRTFADLPLLVGALDDVVIPNQRTDGSVDVAATTPDGKHILRLIPFTSLSASRYSIYLPHAKSSDDCDRVRTNLRAIDKQEAAVAQRTCDAVFCGEQQSESDHHYQGINSQQGHLANIHYRVAPTGGSFSYELGDWARVGKEIKVAFLPADHETNQDGNSLGGSKPSSQPGSETRSDVRPEYRLTIHRQTLQRISRQKRGDLVVDTYKVEPGQLVNGDKSAGRVTIRPSVSASTTPRIVSITLLR